MLSCSHALPGWSYSICPDCVRTLTNPTPDLSGRIPAGSEAVEGQNKPDGHRAAYPPMPLTRSGSLVMNVAGDGAAAALFGAIFDHRANTSPNPTPSPDLKWP